MCYFYTPFLKCMLFLYSIPTLCVFTVCHFYTTFLHCMLFSLHSDTVCHFISTHSIPTLVSSTTLSVISSFHTLRVTSTLYFYCKCGVLCVCFHILSLHCSLFIHLVPTQHVDQTLEYRDVCYSYTSFRIFMIITRFSHRMCAIYKNAFYIYTLFLYCVLFFTLYLHAG